MSAEGTSSRRAEDSETHDVGERDHADLDDKRKFVLGQLTKPWLAVQEKKGRLTVCQMPRPMRGVTPR